MHTPVAGRETAVRCETCHYMGSRTAGTPLDHLKLPLWTFSYVLGEAVQTFPQMISAAQIQRRLGCSKQASLNLKRRLQLFLTDLVPAVRELVKRDLEEAFSDLKLPENQDVSKFVANKPVVHSDTLALFSATQRSNGGRARWKHTGQTASIYLSDKVAEQRGKVQIGTLAHTVAIMNGPVLLTSVRDQTQKSLEPSFNFLPRLTPIMTDEGTPWLSRYFPNHRAVNHSARAKDKQRSKWARDRWSRNGVHNQVAEGNQRIVKMSFLAAYGYFDPKYSQLYLNEYSALKALKLHGLDSLLSLSNPTGVGNVDHRYSALPSGLPVGTGLSIFHRKVQENLYIPPQLHDRKGLDYSDSRRQIRGNLKLMLDEPDLFAAKQAHVDYLNSFQGLPPFRKQNEKKYAAQASALWNALSRHDAKLSADVARSVRVNHRMVLRMIRLWTKLGLVEAREIRGEKDRRKQFWVSRRVSLLPALLYTWDLDGFRNQTEAGVPVDRTKKTRRGKHGITGKERSKFIQEMYDG